METGPSANLASALSHVRPDVGHSARVRMKRRQRGGPVWFDAIYGCSTVVLIGITCPAITVAIARHMFLVPTKDYCYPPIARCVFLSHLSHLSHLTSQAELKSISTGSLTTQGLLRPPPTWTSAVAGGGWRVVVGWGV